MIELSTHSCWHLRPSLLLPLLTIQAWTVMMILPAICPKLAASLLKCRDQLQTDQKLPAVLVSSKVMLSCACVTGDPRAQHWMAAAKWEAGQDAEAMALFEAAAEQAYVPAQHAITAISSRPQAVTASA